MKNSGDKKSKSRRIKDIEVFRDAIRESRKPKRPTGKVTWHFDRNHEDF